MICASCRIRLTVPPAVRDSYNPLMLDLKGVKWLENAAREFDAMCDEHRYTAEEFIAWLRPDLTGHRIPLPEMMGTPPRSEAVGKHSVRHRHADPIPFAPMPAKMRRVGR